MINATTYIEALRDFSINTQRACINKQEDTAALLNQYHPDFLSDATTVLQVGPNQNDPCPTRLANLLQSTSIIKESDLERANTLEIDVLILGGGGAGCAAALEASRAGASVMLATKLRLGDSNTIMAEGGIQAAINPNDSLQAHFNDTYNAGHQQGDAALIKQLVLDGPESILWLIQQGMQFETNTQGDLLTRRAGGTSADRVVHFQDYTGLEMMRTLREAVRNTPGIVIREYSPAIELLSNAQGDCTGAVLSSVENETLIRIKAKSVIIATGGIGRLHLNNFPTSNHLGATGDGLVLAYRLGAKLRNIDSFQYHPTGLAQPYNLSGTMISESIRSAGAQLVNANGECFVDALAPRDIVTAAIIRECREGRGIVTEDQTVGVWLDTPSLEQKTPGILKKQFPKLMQLGDKSGINPAKVPFLIYPTLHYQNGGIHINTTGESTVKNLFSAGETSGGLHGKNRLMGNALLEIISFGRRAGRQAATGKNDLADDTVSIQHTHGFHQALAQAGLPLKTPSPLLFPAETGFRQSKLHNI